VSETSGLAAYLFGESGNQIRDDVVASIIEGEQAAAQAQMASGLTTGDAYGAIWLTVPKALESRLGLGHGAELRRPWRGRYRLPVIGGYAILALRLAKDLRHPLEEATITPSELRRTLINLGLLVQEDPQQLLFGPDGHPIADDDQPRVEGPARIPVLVAGFVSGHDSGLLAARWGLATAFELGNGRLRLEWNRFEELDLSSPPPEGGTLTLNGDAGLIIDPPGFAGGSIPDPPLEIVAAGEDCEVKPGSAEDRPTLDVIRQ
jgi:hypothetical protein